MLDVRFCTDVARQHHVWKPGYLPGQHSIRILSVSIFQVLTIHTSLIATCLVDFVFSCHQDQVSEISFHPVVSVRAPWT